MNFDNKIDENIRNHGYHYVMVLGGPEPRFCYTVGCMDRGVPELIFAGGSFFSSQEVLLIVNNVFNYLNLENYVKNKEIFIDDLGSFLLIPCHESWVEGLMFASVNYHMGKSFPVMQIVPAGVTFTLDVPDMCKEWSGLAEPVWDWAKNGWPFSLPSDQWVVADVGALKGAHILNAAKWDEDEWEMFSTTLEEVDRDMVRLVPLGTLLGIDPALESLLSIPSNTPMTRKNGQSRWRRAG